MNEVAEVPSVVHRLRLAGVCLALSLLAFVQSPGKVAPDTKLDLTVSPLAFLGRALHLWDPQAAFGQLQNQAGGYLLPMGPLFAAGHALELPAWVVQRSWWALLMVVGFLGFVRVAGRLGIGTPVSRILAGLAFALSPRLVSMLGATSVEALPLVMTPWVLLPLVSAAQGRLSARAGALRSGVAVALIGGVNAVATLAALPVSGLFLLCCVRGRTRVALIGWWIPAVLLATLWWLLPLLLQGKYAPPFLAYIEPSVVTTGLTSPSEVLRGTSHWIGYLGLQGGPTWPAAWRLVTDPVTILNTVLLAGLGLLGLARRDLPYRAFLLPTCLLGLVLVTAGHVGSVDGPFAGSLREALDGVLAPFRNVHKFDAVLRLPLLLAACHAMASIAVPLRGRFASLPRESALRGITVVALLGVASPLLLGLGVPRGGYNDVPRYWTQTADFLEMHEGDGRALLVPGSPFADYLWGSTGDEPLQALAHSPWAVRNAIPLAPPGGIRYLDALQDRFRHGTGSPGLTAALLRAGVGLLVVRNDLDWRRTGAPRPALVHQALAESPGIERIAAFGPYLGAPVTDSSLPDAGLDLPYRAVEVFRVGPGAPVVTSYPAATAVQLVGGPEALVTAGDTGLLEHQATTLAGMPAVPGSDGAELVTDTLRRREAPFGALPGDSTTLAADDPYRVDRAAHDYLPVEGVRRQTVARIVGARRLSASSSASDVNALWLPGAQYAPFAAFDGSPGTAWHSGIVGETVGQWLQVDLDEAVELSTVSLRLASGQPLSDIASVTVTTDQGSRTQQVARTEGVQAVAVVPGPTRRLRLTVASVHPGGAGLAVGLRELTIPGVVLEQVLQTPTVGADSSVADYLFRAVPLATDGCVRVGGRPLCTPFLVTPDVPEPHLERSFSVARTGDFGVSVVARPRPGPALDDLVDRGRALRATASTRAVTDPAGRPGAAVDRDLGTGWVADPLDLRPTLTLTWDSLRTVDGVQLLVDRALAASRPTSVTVTAAGTSRRLTVDPTGRVRFPPVRTAVLTLAFDDRRNRIAANQATGTVAALPVGVSEVIVHGVDDLRRPIDRSAVRALACGTGPVVSVDGQTLQTRLAPTVGQLLDRAAVSTLTCAFGPVRLATGSHRLSVVPSPLLYGETVRLSSTRAGEAFAATTTGRPVEAGRWDPERRTVRVGAGPRTVLVVHENANDGWQARLEGRVLAPVVVDGWQQGWVVPAGEAGSITLFFTPGRDYRLALGLGVMALGLLLVLALAPSRKRTRPDATVPELVSPVVLAASGLLLVLLGGVVAGGVLAVVTVLVTFLRRRGRDITAPLIVLALAGTAGLTALQPWPSGRGGQSAAAQVLVLVALAAAVAAQAAQPRWRLRRVRRGGCQVAAGPGARRAGRTARPPRGSRRP